MRVRAACLDYAKERAAIPVRFDLFRKSEKLLDWYIKRYNPFIMEEMSDLLLYQVTLPLIAGEHRDKPEKARAVMRKTFLSLADMDIHYIVPPPDYDLDLPDTIQLADPNRLFPFFIMPAVKKALSIQKKDLRNAEFLIIDGDPYLTEILLDNIYEHVNFLTVMTEEDPATFYESIAEEIFAESGLLLQTTAPSKTAVQTADVVINTSGRDHKLDYSFKKGSVYFELSHNGRRAQEIALKRADMLFVDRVKVKMDDKQISLALFEAYFYSVSREYRYIVNGRYSPDICLDAQKSLRELNARAGTLCFRNQMIR